MNDNSQARTDAWVRFYAPYPHKRLRLFCFPYAGGGASIYHGWRRWLPEWIDVCPIQLPGREDRIREPPFPIWMRSVPRFCALAPALDMPVALFGQAWCPDRL
jgi:medium-chain acyl-[acyl-carrier-protein] hydrolase